MSEWRIISPAPRSAALEVGGPFAKVRKGVLAQVRNYESAAVYHGDTALVVAMFARHGWRRLEMALALSRAAAPHMLRLIRLAQLTLPRIAETHLIVVYIRPSNAIGQRMARLAGFRRARVKNAGLWVFDGES